MHSASLIKDLSEDSQPVINSIHCQSSYDVDHITVKVLNSLDRQIITYLSVHTIDCKDNIVFYFLSYQTL
jgi:hypothetical protein